LHPDDHPDNKKGGRSRAAFLLSGAGRA